MRMNPSPLDLRKLKVYPLSQRKSLNSLERMLVDPAKPSPSCPPQTLRLIAQCAQQILAARKKDSSVILMYGAHLIKNGAMPLVISLLAQGWITHLATNGAGAIHDWELGFFGRTEESVKENVATGTFGTWDETGRFF